MFNTDSTEIWEDEVKPCIEDAIKTCRTDEILVSTLENLLNHVDSDILCKRNFAFRFDPVIKVLGTQTYYTGTLRNAYQDEIKKVKELHEKLSTLQKVVKHEYSYIPKVEETEAKERLPREGTVDLKTVYGVTENTRPRIQ